MASLRKPAAKRKTRQVKFMVVPEDFVGFEEVAALDSEPGRELSPHEWCRLMALRLMRARLGKS